MADSHQDQDQEGWVTHCLLCQQPQECLAVHLARVCMKNETPQKRKKEEWRAKRSMMEWLEKSRVWDYNELAEEMTDLTSRRNFVADLKRRGAFIVNEPPEEAANNLQELTARVPPTSFQTEAHAFQSVAQLSHSSTNGSSEHAEETDPAWLTPHQRSSNPHRQRSQRKKSGRK